jgi:outer membrane murein-binding lipoprotein Lpp
LLSSVAETDEIAAATEQLDTKTGEKANADEKNAQAKNEREDTQNSLSADEKFLMDLKEKCKQTDEEWEQRTKSRQEEIVATSEAIKILSADDARDNFSKTVNTSFVQKTVSNQEKAAQFLLKASERLNNAHLSVIAARVRLDAFVKVKAAIDEMIKQLGVEKADEIKHKDWCVNELNSSKNKSVQADSGGDDAQARIDSLAAQIKALSEQIDTLKKEINDLNKEVKRGGEDREKANQEFQVTLQDQRTMQKLLNKAKDVLARVYDKKTKGVGFTQADQTPPKSFKNYEKKDGGGVIGLLNNIINDSKAVEAEAIHDEDKSQEAYESFIQESNRSIAAKTDALTDARAARAKNEQEKSDEENNHAGLLTEIEQLTNNNIDIHSSCDFVLKNFDIRQQGRDEEVEALRQAKAILSGSNFKSFLQKA